MILKNIKKLKNLLENYDKIMLLIDENKPKKSEKRYSFLNTPKNQKSYIEKIEKRENND